MGLVVMLHLGYVDLVVLGMRSEKLDEDDLRGIVDGYYEPVGIALDVENDALISDDARGPVLMSNIFGTGPFRCFDLLEPSLEGVLGIAIPRPSVVQRPSGDDPHRSCIRLARSLFGSHRSFRS